MSLPSIQSLTQQSTQVGQKEPFTNAPLGAVNGFKSMFGQVVNTTQTNLNANVSNVESISLEELSKVLNTDSLEALFQLLGLPSDQNLLPESLSLENMAETLHLDPEELKQTIHQFQEKDKAKDSRDMWDILAGLNENAIPVIQAIMLSLNGEHSVPPTKAAKVLEFLKFVELAATKSDLVLKQEVQVFQTAELLTRVESEIGQLTVQKSNTKIQLPLFQQLIQQSIHKSNHLPISELNAISANSELTTGVTLSPVSMSLPTNKSSQAEALVKEFQTVINRGQFANIQGTAKLLIKLYPENLGTIRVELMQKDGIVSARLLASTAIGKEMLDSQLHQLKQAFAHQNIQLDRLDVTQALQDASKQERQQHTFNQSQKQYEQEEQKKNEEEQSETHSFNELLVEMEV